jgi:TRAP-type C4-dicarboxylate transport system permease small subunit
MKIVEPTPAQMRLVRTDGFKTSITGFVMLGCGLLILWSGLILVRQIGDWLKLGQWQSRYWTDGFRWLGWDYPTTNWAGIQKIIDWFMLLPLATLPGFIGIAMISSWILYADQQNEATREAIRVVANWKRQQQKQADQ